MKKILFLVLMQFSVSLNLFSQYYFYVVPSSEQAKPNQGEKGISNDKVLNQIFEEFDVKSYYQAFPGARNKELQSFYEIHLTENKDNKHIDFFEKLLKDSKTFDAVYRCDYYEPATCSNPVPINDEWIVNSWINNDALNLLNAQCAWTITTGDSNIIVGVIDTEFEITHEDLINTFSGVVGTQTYFQNHGTYVSSCVATGTNNNKGIAGIGYNTKVKGYHTNGGNLWSNIWQAYQDGIKIINVSWTGIGSYPNILAVQEMTDNGVVLVVAAGNTPTSTSHSAYANIPGVINVSGVDANNTHGGATDWNGVKVANNQWVDVCALSKNVAICKPGNTYDGTAGGTSLASPQVAGVAALIRSINGNLSSAEVEDIIKSTTDPIADAHLYPGTIGTGRVNAYQAVQAACAVPVNFINKTVTADTIVTSCSDINVQNVTVTNGAKLTLDAAGEVNIISDFEVELGSEFEIL